mmetsp:Transcript_107553/g.310836  ORF Transcript_107553/g.310836 Transcript_107553/m.310836 type:complete len:385 (-) Transcript_107553:39-1193(-)
MLAHLLRGRCADLGQRAKEPHARPFLLPGAGSLPAGTGGGDGVHHLDQWIRLRRRRPGDPRRQTRVQHIQARDGDLCLILANEEFQQHGDMRQIIERYHKDLHRHGEHRVLLRRLWNQAEGIGLFLALLYRAIELPQTLSSGHRLVDKRYPQRHALAWWLRWLLSERVLDGDEADVRVQQQRYRQRDWNRVAVQGKRAHTCTIQPLGQLSGHLAEDDGVEESGVKLLELEHGLHRLATAKGDELRHGDSRGAARRGQQPIVVGPDNMQVAAFGLQHQLGVPNHMKGEQVRAVREQGPVRRAQLPRHREAEAGQEQDNVIERLLLEVPSDPARVNHVPHPALQDLRIGVEAIRLQVVPGQHRGRGELDIRVCLLQPGREEQVLVA